MLLLHVHTTLVQRIGFQDTNGEAAKQHPTNCLLVEFARLLVARIDRFDRSKAQGAVQGCGAEPAVYCAAVNDSKGVD
jgi:hypothetical protein